MNTDKIYSAPRLREISVVFNRVIAQSVGGNTGYSGDDLIDGGDLTDNG